MSSIINTIVIINLVIVSPDNTDSQIKWSQHAAACTRQLPNEVICNRPRWRHLNVNRLHYYVIGDTLFQFVQIQMCELVQITNKINLVKINKQPPLTNSVPTLQQESPRRGQLAMLPQYYRTKLAQFHPTVPVLFFCSSLLGRRACFKSSYFL